MSRDEIEEEIISTELKNSLPMMVYLAIDSVYFKLMANAINKWHTTQMKEVLESLKEIINFRLECYAKNNLDIYEQLVDDIKNKFDEEIERIRK